MEWAVITGGGTGIGRILASHFSRRYNVVIVGRRGHLLDATRACAANPETVRCVQADIATEAGRSSVLQAIPRDAAVGLVIQNAAIGDPGKLRDIDLGHFLEAMAVNVAAPLALVQDLLPSLRRAQRPVIVHLGTSVADWPQVGTTTYGVTKAAFKRLGQQLQVELSGIVDVALITPGVVDTEGLREHVSKAHAAFLPHAHYLEKALPGGTTSSELTSFVDWVLSKSTADLHSKEWKFSEWKRQTAVSDPPAVLFNVCPARTLLCTPQGLALAAVGCAAIFVWRSSKL
mmetsp:Transcript_89444/g.239751  ORF Transcript_89444/g.239751 Transcript_89444/m.239751 type:complete len:288 (+) Transcript_89444:19-882(+)